MNEIDKERLSIYRKVSEMEENALKQKQPNITYDTLDMIALATTFINPPIGIALGLATMVGSGLEESSKNKKKLSERRMPDSWLKEVSESNILTDEGLAFLTKCINKKGYVSIEDALKYIDLENELAKKVAREKEKKALLQNDGVVSILKQAENRLGNNYLNDISKNIIDESLSSINKTIEASNKILDIANSGLSFVSKKIKKDQ